jgi:hypothetical protein
MVEVALRLVEDSDLDVLFEQMRDPESVQMAAFTAKDPNDRDAFDAHMAKVRTSPDVIMRAVTATDTSSAASRASSSRATGRSRTGSTVQPGDKASPAKPSCYSSAPWRSGPCMPAPPATTSARSGFFRRQASRSSTPRSPTPLRETPKSRKQSCGSVSPQTCARNVSHSSSVPTLTRWNSRRRPPRTRDS